MIDLSEILPMLETSGFEPALKQALEQLDPSRLPLQENLSASSMVADVPIEVVVMGVSQALESVDVRVSVFYSGVIAGCNCSDDPTPVDLVQECCELLLRIQRHTGQASIIT
jgi:hypothetical protein